VKIRFGADDEPFRSGNAAVGFISADAGVLELILQGLDGWPPQGREIVICRKPPIAAPDRVERTVVLMGNEFA